MFAKLVRVLVRRPEEAACALWLEYGWRSAPDFTKLLQEHDALCALLESAGAEVVFGGPVPLGLDAIYTFDPAIVSNSSSGTSTSRMPRASSSWTSRTGMSGR